MPETETHAKHISKRVGRNVFDTPPKISVVIPAYNSAEYICETLDSVIGQKFREHEIILVNDGSPDTDKLERSIKMHLENIVYIRQRNAGPGAARNTGIENARGKIIAFLDSDDVWQSDYLASQYVFLERHGYDMVYCDAVLFGMRSAYRRTFMETAPSEGVADLDALLDLRCNVITSGTMARKSALVKAGLFENEHVKAEDFHLWLRMAQSGAKIGYQRKPLLKYRVHLDSLSGDAINRVERTIDVFRRVQRTIDLSDQQRQTVENRLAGFEADLAVEKGKAFLLSGDFREASVAFRVANMHRKSIKLATLSWLARLAPRMLLRFYHTHRSPEVTLLTSMK